MPNVEVKQAIQNAIEYLKKNYEGVEDIDDIRLEEVEYEEISNEWLITISMLRETADDEKTIYDDAQAGIWRSVIAAQKLLDQNSAAKKILRRVYKIIRINAETGEFVSMKLREFAS